MEMRKRFDTIVGDAVREIVELAQVYGLELPCKLPSLPGNLYDLTIAEVSLDCKPREDYERSLVLLLKDLVHEWKHILLHPDMDDGALNIHRQSVQGIARNAMHQRFIGTGVELAEFHALVHYPRHDSLNCGAK